jgi:hypothetical protein
VDFVRAWTDKTEIAVSRILPWIGVGTSKFHDWKARFGKVNEHNAWVPRDHWLTDAEKEGIRRFARQHPLEGYRRLTFMMLDADVVACSPASVYRVLRAAGLPAGQTPKPAKRGTGFVQPLHPHEHWQVDVSYLDIAGTFYSLGSILDGCSRFIVHWENCEKMEEADVETIIKRTREAHPEVRPRVISDNGPRFIAKDVVEIFAARDRKLAEARQRRQEQCQGGRDAVPTAPASNPAIDFAALRAPITMSAVLQRLGFRGRSCHGAQQRGPCPLHGSTSGTSRCFSVNLEQHIFHCFKCGRSGNALDLRAHATGQTAYGAALDLCERLHLPVPELTPQRPKTTPRHREEEPVDLTLTTCTIT